MTSICKSNIYDDQILVSPIRILDRFKISGLRICFLYISTGFTIRPLRKLTFFLQTLVEFDKTYFFIGNIHNSPVFSEFLDLLMVSEHIAKI